MAIRRFARRSTAALANMAAAGILSAASEPAVRLAEKLLSITPGGSDRRVWLGHSGSDANETVARAVTEATGRPRILAFSGAYHGGTVGSMAVSGHSAQAGVAKAAGLTLVPYPDPYRPFGGDPTGGAVLAHVEELFATTCPPEEVAAFFLEPIQADGGLIVPPPGFFAGLARLCARHGILTVCDEVKVGLARTGRLHAFEHEDFVPDIIVFGKGLGGGLPISAAVGPERIMNHRSAFSFQTLHGNPASASAALAVLETIEAEGLAGRAAEVGAVLIGRLREAAQGLGMDRRRARARAGDRRRADRGSAHEDARPAACGAGCLPGLGTRGGALLRRHELERAGADPAADPERGGGRTRRRPSSCRRSRMRRRARCRMRSSPTSRGGDAG